MNCLSMKRLNTWKTLNYKVEHGKTKIIQRIRNYLQCTLTIDVCYTKV